MRKLRLIKPWHLPIMRQSIGFDHFEIMCNTNVPPLKIDPKGDVRLEEYKPLNPRATAAHMNWAATKSSIGYEPRIERNPRA